MNEETLKRHYRGPRAKLSSGGAAFFWDNLDRRYPRERYSLRFNYITRTLKLRRFLRSKQSSREYQPELIEDPEIIAVFRAALSPQHIAHLARISIPRQ